MNLIISKILNSVLKTLSIVNPTATSKIRYRYYMGKKLNLVNPQTLNEKMMFLKLNTYWNQQHVADRADKYAVRNVIEKLECSEILNEIYGVWDNVDDIEWDMLPKKFAIKCNHGSGYNIICENKDNFDFGNAKNILRKWMKEKYGVEKAEQGIYQKIKHKIIVEKFIETADGMPPKDYKFFCSYGKVCLLFVASDRINGQTKFDYYYPDWSWIPVKNQHPNVGPIEKPKALEKMIHYAEILSKDFPLVRVDLYNEGEQIIFGELTFTHFGCLNSFDPDEFDLTFGQLFPDVKNLK